MCWMVCPAIMVKCDACSAARRTLKAYTAGHRLALAFYMQIELGDILPSDLLQLALVWQPHAWARVDSCF